MNDPRHTLQALDRHLTAPAELTLFGRAALALGYAPSLAAFARARAPDIPETQTLCLAAQPRVLALAKAFERGGPQTA
jgi:hypothetical protein